jgi:hypothetical protein
MEFRKVKLENGKRENREAEAAATRHSVKGQYVRGVKRRAFVEWLFDIVGFKLAEGKGPGQNHRDAKTAFAGGVGFERIVEICGKVTS